MNISLVPHLLLAVQLERLGNKVLNQLDAIHQGLRVMRGIVMAGGWEGKGVGWRSGRARQQSNSGRGIAYLQTMRAAGPD